MTQDLGWVCLHKKLTNWEWYTDVNTSHLFIYCLLKANYKQKDWQGIKIQRGSFVSSLSKISHETGLSIQSVRTSLKKLEKTKNLTNRSTNKYRYISIVNYDLYQDNNKQLTNNQQTTNKQSTTTNNNNNLTKKQINILFDQFWELYDLKRAKKKCFEKYTSLLKKGIKHEVIMQGVVNYNQYLQNAEEQDYKKHPITYLNNESWEDEYKSPASKELTLEQRMEQIKQSLETEDRQCKLLN